MREFIIDSLVFTDAPIPRTGALVGGGSGMVEGVFSLLWRVFVDAEASDWSPVCHASTDARDLIVFVAVLAELPALFSDISIREGVDRTYQCEFLLACAGWCRCSRAGHPRLGINHRTRSSSYLNLANVPILSRFSRAGGGVPRSFTIVSVFLSWCVLIGVNAFGSTTQGPTAD